jgi:hypothetical protein
MALGSTQPPVKMSTRNIPGGKGVRCVGVTTSTPLIVESHENLEAWNSPWSSFGLYYQLVVIFHFHTKHCFPFITSAGIIRLYKHVPRYKVAFTEVLFIEGSGMFMHILLTAYSVQLKQTRTDELVNKTQKATSISQDIPTN